MYNKKLGFKKFLPCANETSAETGYTIRGFIELVGLTHKLHSDKNKNLKEVLFKQLLRNFGIIQTYTESQLPWQNIDKPAIGEVK